MFLTIIYNITHANLFQDCCHLLENDKQILANDFVFNVNGNFLMPHTFHCNVHLTAEYIHVFFSFFFKDNFFYQKISLKNPKNLKKMLRNFPASNVWWPIFKKRWLFLVFIITGSTILFSKHGKIKWWKRWVM